MRRTGNKVSLKWLQRGKCQKIVSHVSFLILWNMVSLQGSGFLETDLESKMASNFQSTYCLSQSKTGIMACTVIPSQVILFQKVIFYYCVLNKENKGILDIFLFWWSKYVWKLMHFKLHSNKLMWFLILLIWCTYCSLSRPE